jgi:FkbM family methyltransferase
VKALVNIMCCFVPVKKWRRAIRHNLISKRMQLRELVDYGCKIDSDILTTPQGIRIDISETLDNPLYSVIEVFVRSEYDLNIKKDSILIDIGMNRAAASLFFAMNESIKKIYAYEPFKPTFEMAKKNLDLNPVLSKKIIPLNFGLGKSETKLILPYSADASVGMSTTYDVCRNRKNTKKETVIIKDAAKEISSILEENEGRHVIVKCDCEGAEFEIFERLNEENLVGRLDVIIIEYHFEKPDILINILTENGFAAQTKVGSQKKKTGYIYAVRMAKMNL